MEPERVAFIESAGEPFFDTGAPVENDHVETGTADVQRILGEADSGSFISRLATVEPLSGFAAKVRTGLFWTEASR